MMVDISAKRYGQFFCRFSIIHFRAFGLRIRDIVVTIWLGVGSELGVGFVLGL